MKRKIRKHISAILTMALLFVTIGSGIAAVSGNIITADAASKIHLKKAADDIAVKDTYNVRLINANGKAIPASKVAWSSSKKTVATVNKKGLVTTQKTGIAKIYAKYNGKKYTFIANVKKPFIAMDETVLIPGETTQGRLLLSKSKSVKSDNIKWNISDEAVASIDNDGIIRAANLGTTMLVATYNGMTYTKKITVAEPELAIESATVEAGAKTRICMWAQNEQGEKTDWSTSDFVSWESSNASVATTEKSADGYLFIKGNSEGKAILSAKVNEKTFSLNVNVIPKMQLNYTKKALKKGQSLQLKINQTEKIKWTSSDSNVATVSETGLVKAVGYGKADITAEIDGNKAICKITISEPTLYAAKETVTLRKDGVYNLPVTYTKMGTVHFDVADSSVVSCEWNRSWNNQTTKLKINAKEPGTTTITITNSSDNTKVKVKVTVESPLKIVIPTLPQQLNERNYKNKIVSSFKITNIRYETKYYKYDDEYTVTLYFDGMKTYDEDGPGQSSSCDIGWKLYSASGAVVESGTCYSSGLAMGERFEGEKEIIFDLKEGTYTLKLLDTN